jgi:hypothetical protein
VVTLKNPILQTRVQIPVDSIFVHLERILHFAVSQLLCCFLHLFSTFPKFTGTSCSSLASGWKSSVRRNGWAEPLCACRASGNLAAFVASFCNTIVASLVVHLI